jgi:hypothetical protein
MEAMALVKVASVAEPGGAAAVIGVAEATADPVPSARNVYPRIAGCAAARRRTNSTTVDM